MGVENPNSVSFKIRNMLIGGELQFPIEDETAIKSSYPRAKAKLKKKDAKWELSHDWNKGIITVKRLS